ncbi:MAG: hypothetical protein ACI87O_000463 [Planctomycetota bacterium]|jgi:hypothetical protein
MDIQHLLTAGALVLAGFCSASAQAQNVDTLPFPLEVQPTALVDGTFEYQPRPGAFVDLMDRQAIVLGQVELPSGSLVDLDLTRVNADFASMGVQVNGQPSPFDPLDLTLWRGQVSGTVGTDVFLAFSSHGCNGWIFAEGEYNHLMSFVGPDNDWSNASARLVPESILISVGGNRVKLCGNDEIVNGPMVPSSIVNDQTATSLGGVFNSVGATTLECKVAVETDYQYYQNWNNLQACQNYTAILLAEISDRYNSQLDVVLTYPYLQFYSSSNDPWTSQGNGAGAVLDEFRNAWINNIPNGGNLAHFMSGANLGGGVAYLDVLCNSTWGFGVSGNLSGGTQFPVSQSSNTWDFVVVAHELGHNFGTSHTHNYCPPIDECASSANFGSCQNSRNCTNSGTLMSYCHTCSGGMNNITTFFHPTVVTTMRNAAVGSCLPDYTGGGGCTADSLEPNNACGSAAGIGAGSYANLNACGTDSDYYRITVADNESVDFDLSFIDANGDIDCNLWDSICLSNLDSGTTTSNDESVSWTNTTGASVDVTLDVILFGGGTGPGNGYSMSVTLTPFDACAGIPDDALEDNDSCGTALVMADGAETNLFVTQSDADFYELCVPGGGTLDVDALFTSANGDIDIFLYAPGNCGGGNISNLAQGFSGSDDENISWTNTNTENTTVILEARVWVGSSSACNNYDLVIAGAGANCSGSGAIGSLYCSPANINSIFMPALIAATGSSVASDNDVSLTVTQLPPNQFGYFLNSQDQAFIANPGGSMGNLCVGGPSGLGRHLSTLQSSGGSGVMSTVLDLTQIPTQSGINTSVVAGQTYNFQCWYRDFFVASTSNFSDGISILFL